MVCYRKATTSGIWKSETCFSTVVVIAEGGGGRVFSQIGKVCVSIKVLFQCSSEKGV
jgi:hypothetical protein